MNIFYILVLKESTHPKNAILWSKKCTKMALTCFLKLLIPAQIPACQKRVFSVFRKRSENQLGRPRKKVDKFFENFLKIRSSLEKTLDPPLHPVHHKKIARIKARSRVFRLSFKVYGAVITIKINSKKTKILFLNLRFIVKIIPHTPYKVQSDICCS